MKANELRLGNYIQDEAGNIEQVVSLHNFGGDEINEDSATGKYEPIPLTEEWLLKFGFRKENGEMFILEDELIEAYKGEFYYSLSTSGKDTRSIQFVHQLQNLYLALIGEELTIKEAARRN